MADTLTYRKRPAGNGEDAFVVEVWGSTTGSVVLNPEPIFSVLVKKNVYDSVDLTWNIPAGGTLVSLITAAYGTSEV